MHDAVRPITLEECPEFWMVEGKGPSLPGCWDNATAPVAIYLYLCAARGKVSFA